MFSKIFNDVSQKVKVAAGEVGARVTQQANVARELLGLGGMVTAPQLESQLEEQASGLPVTATAVGDIYKKWASLIAASGREGAARYPDIANSVLAEQEENGPFEQQKAAVGAEETPTSSTSGSKDSSVSPPNKAETTGSGASSPPDKPRSSANVNQTNTQISGLLSQHQQSIGREIVGLTFKQVFLRSRALELALISLAKQPRIRDAFMGPLEENESGTPRAHLFQLLSVTLRGDAKLDRELLYLVLTADINSDDQFSWLSDLISVLKIDWMEDKLSDERKILQSRIDGKKILIYNSNAPAELATKENSDSHVLPFDERTFLDGVREHTNRVGASKHMVELYRKAVENHQSAADHFETILETRKSHIRTLITVLNQSKKDFEVDANAATSNQQTIQEAMSKAGEVYVEQLNSLNVKVLGIDAEVAKLSDEKDELLSKLKVLQKQIEVLQEKKRGVLNEVAGVSSQLEDSQRRFKGKLNSEDQLKHHREQRKQDVTNLESLADQSRDQLEAALSTQKTDSLHRMERLQVPIGDSAMHHVGYEKSRLSFHSEGLFGFIETYNGLANDSTKLAAAKEKVEAAAASVQERAEAKASISQLGVFPPSKSSSHQPTLDEDDREATMVNQRNREIIQQQSAEVRRRQLECRRQFSRAVGQLEDIWHEVTTFRSEYAAEIEKGALLQLLAEKESIASKNEPVEAMGDNPIQRALTTTKPDLNDAAAVGEARDRVKRLNAELDEIYVNTKKKVLPFMELLCE
eukprot:GHVN01055754.1.p1 GENE.GHVN01055754.1~~GHVN01055754.1.p1  ORF type:complete len:754 (+),score=136.52 GHVN01055754.1:27-2288(+)